ncbi:MAG: rhodanese-related sulfurtransferase [Flavobacteriales bacterium]|nr:rhodanese-related sulfurtransferase [Flavobacteriales bacterium]
MQLHNQIDKKVLEQQLADDSIERITLSLYKYHHLRNPEVFRDHLYTELEKLGVLGRIELASEGINGQMSVPKDAFNDFLEFIDTIDFLKDNRLNIAVDDDGKSFIKLAIRVRSKILADGLTDASFDVTDKGTHLDAKEFNELTDDPDTVLIDMRNHYESEVGHFEGAITPDVDTFRDSLSVIEEILEPHKDKNIVMYCTGGIRCEKASAWYKHRGFDNVHQLNGGIIEYTRQAKEQGLPNKFIGKNFVFDKRMGERISEDVISNCHQCGESSDTHVNCANEACHLLFIQCKACQKKHEGCCCKECTDFIHLPMEKQQELRKEIDFGKSNIYHKGRVRPKLTEELRRKLKSI